MLLQKLIERGNAGLHILPKSICYSHMASRLGYGVDAVNFWIGGLWIFSFKHPRQHSAPEVYGPGRPARAA